MGESHRISTGGMRLIVACALFATIWSSTPAMAEDPSFTILPPLHGFEGGGFKELMLSGISPDGSVVVGSSEGLTTHRDAAYWPTRDSVVNMGHIGPTWRQSDSRPRDASAGGQVIVGIANETNSTGKFNRAFRWSAETGMLSLSTLRIEDDWSSASGVSADGTKIVGASGAFPPRYTEAYVWDAQSGMQGLGFLPGRTEDFSDASAISSDGSSIVGSSSSANGHEAFLWRPSVGMVGLGDLPGGTFSSAATAVSANGDVVVGTGRNQSASEAFRWTEDLGMIGLGTLENVAGYSRGNGVSGDGSVVVGFSQSPRGRNNAFIWDDENGMRYLSDVLESLGVDLGGWTLEEAVAISDDGKTIMGTAYGTGVSSYLALPFVAVIPEPGTGLLLGAGLVALATRRRRRRINA